MDALVQTIEGSAINSWILSSYWLWPVLEIIHFIGLSLLLGAMLIVDLRLAGYLRQIDIMATHRLFIGFQLKMILVLIAGLNALWFIWKLNPHIGSWDAHGDTPAAAKVVAILSLVAWLGVLLLGRLIPYVGTG